MIDVGMLNAWGAAWAAIMIRSLVDASVLLAVLALIWLPLRRKMSAQFAHGLFLLVLIKVVVPIPASWPSWSPLATIGRAALAVSAWTQADPPAPAPTPTPAKPDEEGPVVVAWAPEPIVAAAATPPAPPKVAPVRIPTVPPKPRPALTIPAVLMMAWAAVSAVLMARFGRSVVATRRLFRRAVTVPDGSGWFAVDFEDLRRTAGVRLPVRWAVSQGLTSPAVGGLLRPTVVMPPDLDEGLSPQQMRWVLLHELAHIRRGDLWVVVGQRLAGALFFFHPAVHVANWVLDQLREYACDDAALAAVQASRRSCGEGFLAIVCRAADRAAPSAATLGLFESRMLIRRRLLRILDGRRAVQDRLSAPSVALLIGLALVVLPYGRPRDATAGPSNVAATRPSAPTRPRADEPRLFAPGVTVLHDDRAASAGTPRRPVLAVACSPDGSTLATAGEDAAVVLRDPATGSARLRLEGHADAVACLAFSPDSKTLASAGYDRTVRLWDATTGRPRAKLEGHESWVFAVAFAPDGRTLASAGSDRVVRLWGVASGRSLGTLDGPTSAIRALAFAPDGRSLAAAGADRAATVWDLGNRRRSATLAGHRGTIRALAFDPDGKTIATASEEGEVRLWDPKSGREKATLTGHSDMVLSLAFSPSGATLASGGLDASIRLWDPKAGRERAALSGHSEGVAALAFAPDGRRLASGGHDGTVRLWDAAAPSLAPALTLEYPGEPRGVAFTPDGQALLASGPAGNLVAYDPHGGLPLAATSSGGPGLAVSPDGRAIAVGGHDGVIRLLDPSTREEVEGSEMEAGEVVALTFGRGGAVLVAGGPDGSVTLWDVATRSKIASRSGQGAPVVDLRASPDGRTIAVVAGGRVSLVDAGSGEPRGTLEGTAGSAAFRPDGKAIATAGPDGVLVHDVATHATRPIAVPAGANAVAYSPDGRFLAVGHAGGEVGLWDAAMGSRVATLKGHAGAVVAVAFDAGGRRIASAAGDRTVRLWDLDARRVTPRASLVGGLACVGPVAASPDGKTLAAAEITQNSAGRIALWDVASRKVRATIPGHDRGTISLAFSPDGETLASSGADRSVRLWDARTGESRGEFVATDAFVRLAFSPDGETLAAAGEDRTLTLWEVGTGSELARFDGFRGFVCTLAFSPDGQALATGGGRDGRNGAFGEVKLFDARTLEVQADLAGHSASVRSVAFSPDGRGLATGGVDASVRLWDLESGRPRLVLGGFSDCVRALGFSPDGRTLAVAGRGDGVVSLFDLADGGEIARLVGHGGPVLGLTYLPDGRTLATGSLDASVKLWDVPATRPAIAGR